MNHVHGGAAFQALAPLVLAQVWAREGWIRVATSRPEQVAAQGFFS